MIRSVLFLLAVLWQPTGLAGDAPRPLLLDEAAGLNEVSDRLVKAARSAQAEASPFRIDVTLYRESLRELMLSNREIEQDEKRIPQHMLVNMVRMSALLHSAAECKTGRYIVCPPELMKQLEAQQQLLSAEFAQYRATAQGTD